GLALRQVEDPRQGDDLDFQPRILVADPCRHLRQQEIRHAIRCADPDLPGKLAGRAPHLLARRGDGLFRPDRVDEEPLPLLGQRIALWRAREEPRRHRLLQPRHAPADRGRVELQDLAGGREAFGARHGKENAQIVPVRHRPSLCRTARRLWETASFPGNFASLSCTGIFPEDPMKELTHWINGRHVKGTSGRFADVMNPATGEVQARAPLATVAELDAAVAEAAKAQIAWGATNPQRRARVMMKFADLINQNMGKLAECVSREHGKTLPDARGDVQRGLEVVEVCMGAPHLLKGEYVNDGGPGIDLYSMRQPLGVVAGITPFNFPAMIPLWKLAPADRKSVV